MPATIGRVFTRGRMFATRAAPTVRLISLRPLARSSQRSAEDQQSRDEPIKFSTSKASHRTWKVHRSMGSQFEQPLWKVVPISMLATILLLWCALRGETDIDAQLEKQLYEHLPGLLSDEEEEQTQSKSS